MSEIHKLYDRQQRIEIEYSGVRREVTPHTIRQIEQHGNHSTVIYSQLDETNAEQVIRDEIAYFKSLGIDGWEWKLFDYDQPADLKDRLIAHGFVPDDAEAALVLDLAAIPPTLTQSVTHDVRRITDQAGLADVRAITRAVWGEDDDDDWMIDTLAATLRDAPDEMSVYVAYVDGVPASYGRIDFHENSDFAGLWGGSTLPEYRQRGLYTALVAVRAQEAIQRGKRYLTIDATPMSRAVLEKFGFTLLAYTYPCIYQG